MKVSLFPGKCECNVVTDHVISNSLCLKHHHPSHFSSFLTTLNIISDIPMLFLDSCHQLCNLLSTFNAQAIDSGFIFDVHSMISVTRSNPTVQPEHRGRQ